MKKSRYVYLTIAIIITILIFSNSLMPATVSSGQSGFVVTLLKNVLQFFKINTDNIDLSLLIRKGAHFTQFFMFGLFWFLYFYTSNKEPYEPFILTLNYGLLTAMTDEFIQYFIPGRAAQVVDVFIDLLGVVAFLMLALIIISLSKLKKAKPKG